MQARRKAAAKKDVNLDALVSSGSSGAYEALQLYRSRVLKLKAKDEFESALAMCANGATTLLKYKYNTAGAELCNLLLDFLTESNKTIDSENVRNVVNGVDNALDEAEAEQFRVDFLKGCIKWSQACGDTIGDQQLHVRLGTCLWGMEQTQSTTIHHFVAGEAPELLNRIICDKYTTKDQALARDRACTTAICHFLALEDLKNANEFFTCFKKAQKKRGNATDESKLLIFCDQLLQCCRRDAQPLFKQIVNAIASDLNGWGDKETVPTMLMGPIGMKFFGIQPKVHPMMQMMQQFLA